jgi:hypothetical protein
LAALEVLTIPGQPKSEKAEELAVTLLEQKDEDFRAAVLQAIERGHLAEALRKQVKDPEILKLLAEIGKSNDK